MNLELGLPNVCLFRTIESLTATEKTKKSLRNKILDIMGHLSQSLLRDRDLFYDAEEIWQELTDRGYSESDISTTVTHIEKMTLAVPGPFWSETIPVYRCYNDKEMTRVTPTARGFLWKLKCRGIIDHALEDEIVQKAMSLEGAAGIREIKTVAALTVFGYEHKLHVDQVDTSYDSQLH